MWVRVWVILFMEPGAICIRVCMFVILSRLGGKFFLLLSMSADFPEPFYHFQYLQLMARSFRTTFSQCP